MFGNTFVNGGGGGAKTFLLFHGLSGVVPAGATYYMIPAVQGLLTSLNGTVIPFPGVLSKFYFRTNGTQPATGSMVCTIEKNIVPQLLTVTVPANAPSSNYTNLINQVIFLGGETLGIRIKNNASSNSAPIVSVALLFEFS